MKVSELKDGLLDYWVVITKGDVTIRADDKIIYNANSDTMGILSSADGLTYNLPFKPSRDWKDGGPIVEREHIGTTPLADGNWYAEIPECFIEDDTYGEGPTPLIAAMRCYVASKFGDTV